MSDMFVQVTILAFIYIPLNLATSIFGMNIQQLDGSGQQIWVFFTTAAAALLITGGSWLTSNCLATHQAVIWYKERTAAKKAYDRVLKSQEYGLSTRLAMLVWLVCNGHAIWMWKSGALGAIMTDNKSRYKHRKFGHHTACDYVSEKSTDPRSRHYFSKHKVPIWSTPWR